VLLLRVTSWEQPKWVFASPASNIEQFTIFHVHHDSCTRRKPYLIIERSQPNNSNTMYYRVALGPRVSRMAAAAVQMPCPHARMLATVGSRQTTDETETPRPKKGRGNSALCIAGGLAAIGAIWYYYTPAENPRIEERKTTSLLEKVGLRGGCPCAADDTSLSVKERMQEAVKSGDTKYQQVKAETQSKVREARDQAGQGLERGKQRYEDDKNEAVHLVSEARSTAGK
jgi:hypothetical protein